MRAPALRRSLSSPLSRVLSRPLSRVLACGFAAGFLLIGARGPLFAGTVIRAQSNGFPGAAPQQDTNLTIGLKGPSMRLLNPAQFHVYTIRLDQGKVWEFSAEHKIYEERSVDSFGKYRKRREEQRLKKIEEYRALKDSKLKEQALRTLRSEGITLDGKIVASSERAKKTRVFKIMVNGAMRSIECYRLRIWENKAINPVFDMWLSSELKIEDNLLRFYRLGTYSEAVVTELKKVSDFPVAIETVVDTGSFKKKIHCYVKSIEDSEELPEWQLTVPSGFTKVPDLKKKLEIIYAAQRTTGPSRLVCKHCGKALGDDPASMKPPIPGFQRQYFCDVACRKKWVASGAMSRYVESLERK